MAALNSSMPVLRCCRPTGGKIDIFLDGCVLRVLPKLNTHQTEKRPILLAD